MQLRNTKEQFGLISKTLHWLIALCVIVLLMVGVSFNFLPRDSIGTLIFIHKSAGITVLGLMLIRLMWQLINPYPEFPHTMPFIEKILARFVHGLLYVAVIAMPITGIVMSLAAGYTAPFWGLFSIHLPFITENGALKVLMVEWHKYLAWTIFALLMIHTVATLKHHYINKDGILRRIWFK